MLDRRMSKEAEDVRRGNYTSCIIIIKNKSSVSTNNSS